MLGNGMGTPVGARVHPIPFPDWVLILSLWGFILQGCPDNVGFWFWFLNYFLFLVVVAKVM
jgi:hypothetical protein